MLTAHTVSQGTSILQHSCKFSGLVKVQNGLVQLAKKRKAFVRILEAKRSKQGLIYILEKVCLGHRKD